MARGIIFIDYLEKRNTSIKTTPFEEEESEGKIA